MPSIPEINLEDYYYELPENRIAEYPLDERDNSKLLVINRNNDNVSERVFSDLPDIINENFHIVFNNTKVIPARFYLQRPNDKIVEIFCLNPEYPSPDPQISLVSKSSVTWNCLIRGKRIKVGETLTNPFPNITSIQAKILSKAETFSITFEWTENLSFYEVLTELGSIPLPPYIKREIEESDKERYQTIFAKYDGSVAAPTAALHFTNETIEKLKSKEINSSELILHVGAGTFKPLTSNKIEEHTMHQEFFSISKSTIVELKNAIENNKKILAVGTTSVRTLESIFIFAEKLINEYNDKCFINQWEVYEQNEESKLKLINEIIKYMDKNHLDTLSGETQLIIIPGYKFRFVDAMITNFHQPKSTLILLVAAFTGKELWQKSYHFALENNFRFLSYGDSSIIL